MHGVYGELCAYMSRYICTYLLFGSFYITNRTQHITVPNTQCVRALSTHIVPIASMPVDISML